MDLEFDLKMAMHLEFDTYSIRLPIRERLHDMLIDYLTVLRKMVVAKPRKVLVCEELAQSIHSHPKKREIEVLIRLFENGQNVNSYQSRRLFQSNFHDHLLYDWHIYHFHLSLEKDKKSNFCRQVNDLLFIYIDDENAVLLGTEKHRPGIFGDQNWLERLYSSFPDILDQFISDFADVYPPLNAIERQDLWNKGYTIGMTKVFDKVIHSPGIGRMSSGHSIQSVMTADSICRWIGKFQEDVENFGDIIIEHFEFEKLPKYRVRVGQKTFEIYEEKSNCTVLEFPLELQFDEPIS
jgi:hypothetical protein